MASPTPLQAVDSTAIRVAAAHIAFGKPLITNVLRGLIAETIVAKALGERWMLCSEDYSAWDLRRDDGLLLEVKQSAARQSWATSNAKPSRASFDIAVREGRYDGAVYVTRRCRWADIYVFAHHAIFDGGADHCDPNQWTFYIVPTTALPHQKQIGLKALRLLAPPCEFAELHTKVEAIADLITPGEHTGSQHNSRPPMMSPRSSALSSHDDDR